MGREDGAAHVSREEQVAEQLDDLHRVHLVRAADHVLHADARHLLLPVREQLAELLRQHLVLVLLLLRVLLDAGDGALEVGLGLERLERRALPRPEERHGRESPLPGAPPSARSRSARAVSTPTPASPLAPVTRLTWRPARRADV